MFRHVWTRAERALSQALKSESGPPYSSVFSTTSQTAIIPADFEASKYPGLLFLHFTRDPRSAGSPTVVAYWTSEASFTAVQARLTRELCLGPLLSSGLISDVRFGKRTFAQNLLRLSLREALIAVSAIVSALVLVLIFSGDAFSYLFAAPRIDVVTPRQPLDFLEGTQSVLPLKIRSRLVSRNVELELDGSDPLRLESAGPSTSSRPGRVSGRSQLPLTVEGGRPPLVPAGQTIDLNLRLGSEESSVRRSDTLLQVDAADPRPNLLHLKGRLLATRDGWLWPRLQYDMPDVQVRIWGRVRCTQRVELRLPRDNRAAAKVEFTGRVYAGEARDAVRIYVEALNLTDVNMSATDEGRLITQEQSPDGSVKVLDWTRSLRGFTINTFAVILESTQNRSVDDWQRIGSGITTTCL